MITNCAHLGFLLLAILAIVRRERVGFAVTVLVYAMLLPMVRTSGEVPLKMELRFGLLVGLVILFAPRLLRSPLRRGEIFWHIALLAWFAVSASCAADSLEAWMRTGSFVAIFLLSAEWCTEGAFREAIRAYHRAAAVVAISSLILMILAPGYAYHGTGRLQGCLNNPNDLGTTLWLLVTLSAGAIVQDRGRLFRLYHLSVIVLALVLLDLTASRSSIAALLAVAAAAACLGLGRRRLVIASLICSVLLCFQILYSPDMSARMLDYLRISDQRYGPDISSGRDREQRRALALFAEHPVVGLGLGNVPFDTLAKKYEVRAVAQLGYHLVLVESGLPGLLLLLCAFGAVLIRIFRCRNRGRAPWPYRVAAFIVIGYLVNCIGESYIASATIYPTLLAWLASCYLLNYRPWQRSRPQAAIRYRGPNLAAAYPAY